MASAPESKGPLIPEDVSSLEVETKHLQDLQQQKEQLTSKVQTLRRDLKDWRSKLDSQIKAYRTEIGELRKTLNTEIETLRNEFQDLRVNLKTQLEEASALVSQEVGKAKPAAASSGTGASAATAVA